MYHISDIKKFLRCQRLYYFSKDENNVFKPYLRSDENIVDLLKEYFGIKECFEGVRNDPGERFFSQIDQYEWFVHPRFVEDKMRVNVPFMHKNGDLFDLYFMYYGTYVKDLDTLSYRITLRVLKDLGIKIGEIYLIRLNGDYVNEGTLDPKKLFLCENSFNRRSLKSIIEEVDVDFKRYLKEMEAFDPQKEAPRKCRYCKLNGLCDHYDKCFPNEEKDADDSILTLVSSQYKNRMYEEGIRHLKDVNTDLLEGSRTQYAQIIASRNGGLFIDHYSLSSWLDKISKRPISFIDFEWDRYLIPSYEKMRPMDVVCFEFALYYIDENGHMEHRTFVGTGDCRREFVEALLEYLPKEGPILAYNAQGAECLRLIELSVVYPEYKEELEKIVDRFVDLAVPFIDGLVYDVRMQGNYSLKKLVDICSDYSYKDLDIYDGMEAVYSWRDIANADEEKGEKIVENLKEYCSLDAYGLFLVYRWLIQLMLESK